MSDIIELDNLLDETFTVVLREVVEADGSFTKKIFIARHLEGNKLPAEPDEAILVQQQGIPGPNSQLIEGIAECFFRMYMDEIEKNDPTPEPEPELPVIVSATNLPNGQLPKGKIQV
jgi:hypothetical protein